jgi:Zn-dependent peptidase ImmA (M78 family)/transcriptional regulator with XRE-family HTH domain
MAEKAFVTPEVLRWARKTAKMNEQTAAEKISVSADRIREWELGLGQPTIKQAQKLAKVYRRPFALLFLPEVPKDFKPLEDFRKPGSKDLTTSSIFIIREIQQKQTWARESYLNEKQEPLPFIGRFSLENRPKDVADDILQVLGINPSKYISGNPLREWIDSAETNGIFIARTSNIHSRLLIDSDELQGFAIADHFAPFIFVNSEDWNTAQLFTLVHELAHLWIAASGISNAVNFDQIKGNTYHKVERFCNEVAASALMPEKLLRSENISEFSDLKDLSAVSRKYGVSSFALLVRLLNLNIISNGRYQNLKQLAAAEYNSYIVKEAEQREKQKTREGGPNYYLLQCNKNGRLFTQIVLDAYRGGNINPTLASDLLNVRITKFQKLEAQLYK